MTVMIIVGMAQLLGVSIVTRDLAKDKQISWTDIYHEYTLIGATRDVVILQLSAIASWLLRN